MSGDLSFSSSEWDALAERISKDRETLKARLEVDRRDLEVFADGVIAWKASVDQEVA